MNYRSNLLALFATFTLMTTSQIFASEDPELTATILNSLKGEAVPAGTSAVSNVKRIESKIVLDHKSHTNLPPFSEVVINPEPTRSPDHFVIVRAIERSTGALIPVKVAAYGKTVEGGKEAVEMTIEIIEEKNVRQNKIQTFVDQVRNEQSAAPGVESQGLVEELTAKNADIVSALGNLYIENRIGSYTLIFEYHSTQAGSWAGQITSLPIAVQVLDKGSFFDSIKTP